MTNTDNDLHVALDVLARRPFDGMVTLDADEAEALQQLIVDMHEAHAGAERRLSPDIDLSFWEYTLSDGSTHRMQIGGKPPMSIKERYGYDFIMPGEEE